MAYASPEEIAESLLRELGSAQAAIEYAEWVARMNGELSVDYSQAAEIIREKTAKTPS